jgi:hypothetical protein
MRIVCGQDIDFDFYWNYFKGKNRADLSLQMQVIVLPQFFTATVTEPDSLVDFSTAIGAEVNGFWR